MASNYYFTENGVAYSFDDVFIPADRFRDNSLWTWGNGSSGNLGINLSSGNRSTPVTTFAGGTNWKQSSDGDWYKTAIKTDGTLWVWGYNNNGQLGTNDIITRSTPVTTFAGGTNWKQVSSGEIHTAAIKTDGTLWLWGDGSDGELGTNDLNDRSTPVTTFIGGTDWKQVSCGYRHTSAIKTDGTLWTWGEGLKGQLGVITTLDTGVSGVYSSSSQLPGTSSFSSFPSTGNRITTSSGSGTVTNIPNTILGPASLTLSTTPTVLNNDDGYWTLTLPFNISFNGTTYSTIYLGTNSYITFGGGSTAYIVSASQPAFNKIMVSGSDELCQRIYYGTEGSSPNRTYRVRYEGTTDRTLSDPTTTIIWEAVFYENSTNQIDIQVDINERIKDFIGMSSQSTPATTFAGGTNWKQVSTGYSHTAAVKTDGTLWTWGSNSNSQLGINVVGSVLSVRSTPVTTFAGGTNWKQVSACYRNTFAIKTDGTLWVWGNNDSGQLGKNLLKVTITGADTPITTFTGGSNWADTPTTNSEDLYTINAGGSPTSGTPYTSFSAAIKTDGTLWTWGYGNNGGQLGNNSTNLRSTPVTTFAGGTNWKQISCGQFHVAAIKTDGTLWVWGNGSYGRLGTNNTSIIFTPVTTFAGGTNWQQASAAFYHTSAIKTDGTLWTWGNNTTGQLGTNNTTTRSTPVTTFAGGSTAGGNGWRQVNSGYQHTAAIKTDGTLWTWGLGTSGQLGTNDIITRSTPVTTFAGGSIWNQVSTHSRATAAIKTDGTLWIWGKGSAIGNNNLFNRNISTPVTTFAGGTNWKQVSVGNIVTSAIKTDGTLWTWGYYTYKQFGIINDRIHRSTPITTFIGGTTWTQVHCGDVHTIALRDNQIYLWGNNSTHQLGVLNYNNSLDIVPATTFSGGTNWKQVSSAWSHTTAIKTDGTLWTWGSSSDGILGNLFNGRFGLFDSIYFPTPITTFAGGTNWKQTDCHSNSSSAIQYPPDPIL